MAFVGRARPLRRLLDAAADASRGNARFVLVSGQAGIGKTTLVGAAVRQAGWATGWGTAADAARTPAFWPWTAALRSLLATEPADLSGLPAGDAAEIARLLPELVPGVTPPDEPAGDPDAARLRLFDALARLLERLARPRPALLVLDDLQWADSSSLALLDFVARAYRPVPLLVIGAYRPDELSAQAQRVLAAVAAHGESIQLGGLTPDEVRALVAATCGPAAADRLGAEVHRRSGGHPFFARQLAELLSDPGTASTAVPSAVRELLLDRLRRLDPAARALVEAAALAGTELQTDVLAEVCGTDPATIARLVDDGVRAGFMRQDGDAIPRLAHDLVRETVREALPAPERMALHQRLAEALEHRYARGGPVVPADLARHCAAAVPLAGPDRAVHWARSAARAEYARLAFDEAAGQLARARRAIEGAGAPDTGGLLVDLLIEEADAHARAGDSALARTLLGDAADRAGALADGERLARAALSIQRLGARFAMPREAVVEVLEAARQALAGSGSRVAAGLTAALARELHHSVPAHRARARPLSEEALALARRHDDPATLADCLLARHDVLWTAARAGERIGLAREIAELAERAGDPERHAEGLLLTANALLETGSAGFRPVLAEYLAVTERFGQPRHDYLALTRRGALALIDGRLDDAERLIDDAAALGERIGEPDAGNVRMSQLLGLARGRGEPEQLRAVAAEAVRWWVGVPSHAHAVAAGLLAEAGDLAGARRSLDAVLALDAWRTDRSYLWSVFIGGMTTAAVRLDDRACCAELLAELRPVADACGVNGALVCFMGSNAHWAGLLAGALGQRADARRWLEQARDTHRRLGAQVWETESATALAALGPVDAPPRIGAAELRRDGELWRVGFGGRVAHLPDLKGLADLALLLARPGVEVTALELVGSGPHDRKTGPVLDARARAAYRTRLAELDRVGAGRTAELERERRALLAQLGGGTALAGRARPLGASTVERARKAVTARLRDAIRRIGAVHPELGAHLDRSVITGTSCRYQPVAPMTWLLSPIDR